MSEAAKTTSREMLLNAAASLMAERSSVDVSLQDIARHSGLNAALVKYYFGTKQGMMLALAEDVVGRSVVRLGELVEFDMSPTEKLKLHIQAIIKVYFHHPYINQLLHYLSGDSVTREIVAERINKPLAEAQRRLLEQGFASGEFKRVDPMMFYFIILGACDHLFFGQHILKAAFGVDRIDDEIRRRYAKTLLNLVMNGVSQDREAVDAQSGGPVED